MLAHERGDQVFFFFFTRSLTPLLLSASRPCLYSSHHQCETLGNREMRAAAAAHSTAVQQAGEELLHACCRLGPHRGGFYSVAVPSPPGIHLPHAGRTINISSRTAVVAHDVRRSKQYIARKELQKRAKQEYLRRIYEVSASTVSLQLHVLPPTPNTHSPPPHCCCRAECRQCGGRSPGV